MRRIRNDRLCCSLIISGEAEEQNKGDNLHVSGLARSVTQANLDEMFNKHGRVGVG